MKGYYSIPRKEEKNPLHETSEWKELQKASREADRLRVDVSITETLSKRYPELGFGDILVKLEKKLSDAKWKLNKANDAYCKIEEEFVNGGC